MKLSLDLKTKLTQTLTPQQIQYLKLLQLPVVQLEQRVRQELEQNPMLEEFDSEIGEEPHSDYQEDVQERETSEESPIDDQADPFEFYKMLWRDDSSPGRRATSYSDDEEDERFYQIKDAATLSEDIIQQMRLLPLSEEEMIMGEQIIGNVDNDGYLRRELEDIVEETNDVIEELNFEKLAELRKEKGEDKEKNHNPARDYAVSPEALKIAKSIRRSETDEIRIEEDDGDETEKIDEEELKGIDLLKPVNINVAEKVLDKIQSLEPPGFASRDVRECLLAQCRAIPKKNAAQKLAQEMLENTYRAFTMKHYDKIKKQLGVDDEYLREAIEFIRTLNPKPGGIDASIGTNTVTPDFAVTRDRESDELLISVNDSRMPVLKLNKAYEKLKKEAKIKVFNKDTREWIRNKYEDAKFLIQAIRQRKSTMLKVMTAIAHLQENFFYEGPSALKPLIYKNVAEETGLDISTICRIVNGKYVQTDYGVYELKYFFSESLPNLDGEEISTTVIKETIKGIINQESKKKPFSDEKISKELNKRGYQIARRTVAKYREQMKIPVARLRKEL